jgi:hypothetical protein
MDNEVFKQGGEQYSRLRAQLDAGQITQQQFDAAIKSISVQDARGQTWTMDTNGSWQRQGSAVNAPGSTQVAPAVEATPAARPSATESPAPARPASKGGSRLVLPMIAGCLVLVCLVGLGAVFLVAGPAVLQVAQGVSTATALQLPAGTTPILPFALPTETEIPAQVATVSATNPSAPVQAPTFALANATTPAQVPPVAAANPTTPAGVPTKAPALAGPTKAPARATNDCGVITQQEAAQLLGVPVDQRQNETLATNQVDFFTGQVSVIQSACSYDEGTHLVNYNVYKPDQTPPNELARLWAEYKASDPAGNQSISGIGDDAFVSSGILKVKKGNYYMDIIVIVPGIDQSGPAPDPKQLDLEKSFAQKALARLPR